jgi:hypothetical protein
MGVRNALIGVRSLAQGTDDYGNALEHFIYCELCAWPPEPRISKGIEILMGRCVVANGF